MTHLPTTAREALQAARQTGLDRLDAQVLLLHCLGREHHDRAWLIAHDSDTLPTEAVERFTALCQRRLAGEPVAYLVGQREFHGLTLQVDARVLDPRPDTETLVDWALDALAGQTAPAVLDLGTGSGAIALALASERGGWQVTGVDRIAEAVALAERNRQRLGLTNAVFRQSSWFEALPGERFGLILSNPPYIAASDRHLGEGDVRFEPLSALVAGADGLDDIRQIVAQAPSHLEVGGWLLLEHGYDQAQSVKALLATHGFAQVQSRNDLAGIARCTGGQWPAAQTVK